MNFKNSKAGLSVALFVSLALTSTHPASASVCYTSGKVYVQQKVYDKAVYFLECARKGEPENVDVLSLLAFARAQQRQYKSAGAAFQLALEAAKKKKDEKKVQDIERNRLSVNALLFNAGVKALSGSQGAEPPTEATLPPYAPPSDAQSAVTDTTVFPAFTGASRLEEAAYDFVLASYVDPSSIETYQNLTYVLSGLGRTDDAILAARTGLKLKPDDQRLLQNLRAAVMGKAVKLYNDGKYEESIVEFRQAMSQDPEPSAAPGYQLRIAGAWMKRAEEMEKKEKGSGKAAYDSAATGFAAVQGMSAASDSLKQNAAYNSGVIYSNMEAYDKAIAVLDPASAKYPGNKDIWSLNGQIKFQKQDYAGAVKSLREALKLDPEDPAIHQFLFLSLNKMGKPGSPELKESINEYTIYKALTLGSKKNAKVWVDSADNRLGAGNQVKTVVKTDGYPDEIYTYSEENKTFETWFFWTKGKSVTFLDGAIFSSGAVPPKKS